MTRLAPSPWPISSRMIDSTSLPYSSSSVSKPPRSANSTPVSSIASTTSATENSSSVSTSTTTSGVPSSCASKPRSRTCRNGTASSRSAMCPSVGHALLERYVEERLDDRAPAADDADGVAVAGPRRAPDDRPRLVPLERGDGVPGRGWRSCGKPRMRCDTGLRRLAARPPQPPVAGEPAQQPSRAARASELSRSAAGTCPRRSRAARRSRACASADVSMPVTRTFSSAKRFGTKTRSAHRPASRVTLAARGRACPVRPSDVEPRDRAGHRARHRAAEHVGERRVAGPTAPGRGRRTGSGSARPRPAARRAG